MYTYVYNIWCTTTRQKNNQPTGHRDAELLADEIARKRAAELRLRLLHEKALREAAAARAAMAKNIGGCQAWVEDTSDVAMDFYVVVLSYVIYCYVVLFIVMWWYDMFGDCEWLNTILTFTLAIISTLTLIRTIVLSIFSF